MQILYVTDLHGMESHYQAAFAAAVARRAELLLLGGDLCPDGRPKEQADWVFKRQAPMFAEFFNAGGCPVAAISGNHDTLLATQVMQRLEGVHVVNCRTVSLAGLEVSGFPFCPPSPFPLQDFERLDLRGSPFAPFVPTSRFTGPDGEWASDSREAYFSARSSLEEELEGLPMDNPARTIFIAHAPPDGGVLDQLYGGIQCGSVAVRQYIARWQPAISLHGHVHESPFLTGHCGQRLGRSLCINPGQLNDRPVWAALDPQHPAGTWTHSQGLGL